MAFDRKPRIVNGYRVIYKPNHFSHTLGKDFDGYVYEHRYVVEKMIGRALENNEIVHHKDGDKLNNAPDNLMLMTRNDHSALHEAQRGHMKCDARCVDCGERLKSNKQKRCRKCSGIRARKVKVRPPKDVLEREVKLYGYCATGRKYGVSDNAIRKWLKS